MIGNTRTTYGSVAQALHWATALLILTLLALGLYMEGLPESTTAEVEAKFDLYSLHKTIGIATLAMAIARVLWALSQPHPVPLNSDRKIETLAAQTVHWMLYGAIIAMPVTGWMHHAATEGFAPILWPLSQDLPFIPKDHELAKLFERAHYGTAILLGIALALHIAGALKHAVIDRDGTLRRMIPGLSSAISADLPNPYFKRLPAVLAIAAFVILSGLVLGLGEGAMQGAVLPNSGAAQASSSWEIDIEQSQLGIEVVVQDKPFSGHFQNWSAAIDFDPGNPGDAKAEVQIDIASLVLEGLTEQAIGSGFLDAAAHPVSTFVSDSFEQTGPDMFQINGRLMLAGQEQALTLPFKFERSEDHATAAGQVTINRLDFGIGPEQNMVAFEVNIIVSVFARPAATGAS